MARIRSIHPGLFTDEAFMQASAHARLLILGIWCEAWDDGVFEWKPLTLKARIFPADNVDVGTLLAELEGLQFLQSFTVNGKQYGAIRNFQKYQRPKKPNKSGVLPEQLHPYVHQVPNQLPTSGEKSPQMEDGGWRGGEEEDEDTASAASSSAGPREIDLIEAERRCREAAGSDRLGPFAPIAEILLSRKADLDLALTVIRARPATGGAVSSWKFYAKILADKIAEAAPPKPGAERVFVIRGSPEWDARVAAGHKPGLSKFYPEHQAEGWLFATPSTPLSTQDEKAA